jgi:hypothetical protein
MVIPRQINHINSKILSFEDELKIGLKRKKRTKENYLFI